MISKFFKRYLPLIVALVLMVSISAGAETVNNFWIKGSNGQLYTNSGNGQGNAVINVAGCNGCGGGGGGGVTSVGLALPTAVFNISGSPVTGSGTLTGTFDTQSANTIFAGPTNGAAATPTFRSLVAADLPAGTGSVTSVGLTMPTGFSVANSPITSNGTLAVSTTLNGILRGTGSGFATTTIDSPLSFSGTNLSLLTQQSITSDGSGLKLSGDVTSPGNNYVYGTNPIGVRAWLPQSSLVVPISTLTDATGNGNAANAGNQLNWSWNSLAAATGLNLTSSSTAAASNSFQLMNIGLTGANANANQVTVGLNIDNQKTGSGAQNVALRLVAGNGAGGNFAVKAAGKVLIGDATQTAVPASLLTVGALGQQGTIGIVNSTGRTVQLAVPTSTFTDWTMTYPDTPGNSGEVQVSNGAGVMSWAALPTTVTPAGSDTEIQINNSGAFGASSNFTFNPGSSTFTLNGFQVINGGAGIPLQVNSDAAQALVVAGNSLPGTYLSSGGVTNGEMGIFENVQSFGIATYTNADQNTGNPMFFFGNRKFSTDVATNVSYIGDPQINDARFVLTGGDTIWAEANYNGLPSRFLDIDFSNGAISFGDLSISSNGTRMVIDDTGLSITATAGYFVDTGAVATDAMTVESAGGSITISDTVRGVYYDPATTQTGEDIVLPATPVDGQEVLVVFGGQITSGSVLITPNILPSGTQSVIGTFSGDYKAGESFSVKYRAANTTWYKIY